MGEKFNLISPIPEDPMEDVEDISNQEISSTAQRKRTSELSESTRQSSSKKQKTSTDNGKSATLKRLIKELKKDPEHLSSNSQKNFSVLKIL